MKTKVGYLTISFLCMTIALALFGGPASGADKKGRTEISAGEKALAMLEVQNAFSKHAFYHQVGQHCEEIEDLWVKINGEYSKTATWNLGGNFMQGMEDINYNYCIVKTESKKKKLESLSKIYPAVKNIPENLGAGEEYVMHTQETPVIEVAGDGKTAKGIWYSIGLAVNGNVSSDGQTSVSTGWMWEKYAVDFIKEDGEWKIWHLYSKMDQGPVTSGGQGQGAGGAPGGGAPAGGQAPGGSGGMKYVKQVAVPKWSATAPSIIDPKFPEPYYTFSETFSY